MSSKFFSTLFFLFLLILQYGVLVLEAQQAYVDNHQLDCHDSDPSTKGYLCNGVQSSCQSYITFRANPPYNSPAKIGYLLGSQSEATLIASMNNISCDVATIPTNKQVVVPVNCSCHAGLYYQHNATYRIKDENENYFTLANDTYQGLTTCQSLWEQNPYDLNELYAGSDLHVPLRCACPTPNQTASGVKCMLTYMVTWGDYISLIAELFNANEQSVLDANELLEDDLIYPFTPILVPLLSEPSTVDLPGYSPPPTRTPPVEVFPVTESSNSKKWVFFGTGIGAVLLVLVAFSAFSFWYFCRRPSQKSQEPNATKTDPSSVSHVGIEFFIESLIIYKFDSIQTATGNFSEDNRVKGSVYKGIFEGDHAAVKAMRGDVSSEIDILKKMNHSNIVRLSGFCVHEGNTYLVYQYAENGSLDDWLHLYKNDPVSSSLSWKQRLQIAYNVADAFTYLHNYTTPPFVHKNLTTSNILLHGNFRAMITNFGLARKLSNDDQGAPQLTRHVVGTNGYMAPEYLENGLITPKLDVFAYGVVILELLSGKKAVMSETNGEEKMLFALINNVLEGDNVREKLKAFIDPCLRGNIPLHFAFSIAQLAKDCVAHDPNDRPSMLEVFMSLSKILSSALD
ncbi:BRASSINOSTEROID INSENSITIVE 1-associated receptor kinase 1 precursor, putative [Ricinus communis]|uniref:BRASSINOSTEROID INSENSITIVE 1-associated receptor kinase 1, putative n=1 Tax=Ricinus communis TaxID=3988 RepID=B9S9A0_RICCO|nr:BRASSINOSTEROID INSENSITIVE 1-associated receptor kinase 1 precursor, putative [Ricinus communis]|eukprot:XP_002522569.1 protein LYK5 [Ricinus communis]